MSTAKWDAICMRFAFDVATMSTCKRLHVGCVIVDNEVVIGLGWNRHTGECLHEQEGNCGALHAENKALNSARDDSCEDATVYLTHSPCLTCAMKLVNASIERVVYSIAYRKTDGIDYLRSYGVKVDRVLIGSL